MGFLEKPERTGLNGLDAIVPWLFRDVDAAVVEKDLVEVLKSEQVWMREASVRALAEVGAATALLPALADKEPQVRAVAVTSLGGMGAEETLPQILKGLDDEFEWVRWSALTALGELGGAAQVPILLGLLEKDGETRSRAIAGLKALGAREAAPAIARYLMDEDPSVRSSAATALAALGARDQVPRIARLLGDEGLDYGGTPFVSEALCRLGSREGVPFFFEQGWGWSALNALRDPGLYKEYESKRLRRDVGDGRTPTWKLLAAEIGVPIDVSEMPTEDPALTSTDRLRCRGGRLSFREALEAVFRCGSYSAIVLERDKVRVLSHDPAFDFWARWWDGERGKK
jgi:hypothetical protein